MALTEFKGRRAELRLLDSLWNSSKAALLILYGRRRVGKTRLLTHWLGGHPGQSLYWVAEPTAALDQLRSFSQAIYDFANPDNPAPLDFTYANWEQALQQVASLAKTKRLALFIDEVTYLIDVNPAIVGTLQKAWDHWLSKSNLMFGLSGSQMGLMQKQMLSYQAPLYGRATAQVKLPPLPFSVTEEFFPHYNAADRVAIYAIFGGIPAYWERLDTAAPLMENVRTQLLTPNTLMHEEPRLLLQDFINDAHNYVGIMRAIAQGSQTQNSISKHTGLSKGHVSKYLSVLRETGFVERQVPLTETAESRLGRYFVTDPYLRFYYRFLSAYQAQLAMGSQQQALRSIEQGLAEFIESSTWQELGREWLLRASAAGEIPCHVQDVGSIWKRTQEFPVVGINQMDQTLVLGNCLWRDTPAGIGAVQELVMRTASAVPEEGNWTVYYLGFASAGWTDEAKLLAEKVIRSEGGTRNWQAAGIKLVGLSEVEADLDRWTMEL